MKGDKMKKCPNCEAELIEQDDGSLYCEACDLSYSLDKGKAKVKAKDKGKVRQLEEKLAEHEQTLQKVVDFLFGSPDEGGDFWDY